MSTGTQPSRALLITAGVLTQLIGLCCLVLALVSIPVIADLRGGLGSVVASVVASLAALVCGTLVWRGRLVPLALAAGLDVGFGIGLPREGSAIGTMLRILPAEDAQTAESIVVAAAIVMFAAAILCVISVPSALKLRQWARAEQRPPGPAPSEHAMVYAGTEAPPGSAPNELATLYAPSPVRASEQATLYAPSNDGGPFGEQPAPGSTLRGLLPMKIVPTQVLDLGAPRRGRPVLIIGTAVTIIALTVLVISAATSSKPEAGRAASAGSAKSGASAAGSLGGGAPRSNDAARTDGGIAAAATTDATAQVEPETVEAFADRFHEELATRAALPSLFDETAFAFGVQANDVAEGRDAVVAQLRDDLGAPEAIGVKFSHIGRDAEVAWLAEELRVGSKTFVITAILGLRDGKWTIAALHWAEAMPNATAYRLARGGSLDTPDAIPDTYDASPLAVAMRTAFASKPSFVDARSTRSDAFNFGSAPGERIKGGETIRKVFGRIAATIRLHDAVKVGAVGPRGGWGVANVTFTDADRDGAEVSQTFRVLCGWVQEDAGWRIVMTHWSNAK